MLMFVIVARFTAWLMLLLVESLVSELAVLQRPCRWSAGPAAR